jgi:general secretion pathway protein A
LETTDEKLLQIVLVGQPELDEKLDSVGLRQLKQRIALRAHLGSLDADETREYIERRLQIAGADLHRNAIFSAEAIAAIFDHSRGLPRLINSISENALIAAYARQLPVVPVEIVDDIAREFRLSVVELPVKNRNGSENAQRAANSRQDVVATLQRPVNGTHAGKIIGVEAKKHEPYI